MARRIRRRRRSICRSAGCRGWTTSRSTGTTCGSSTCADTDARRVRRRWTSRRWTIRPSRARRSPLRTWAPPSTSSSTGAASRSSTCSGGRGEPRSWAPTPRSTTRTSSSSCCTRRQWIRAAGNASLVQAGNGPIGAYRTVSIASAKQRWLSGVAPDKAATLIPPGWFEQWSAATWATDPKGGGQTLRAPNGTAADTADYWGAGKALYDPAGIRVPTLLVHAEWDADLPTYMDDAYFKLLTDRAVQAVRADRRGHAHDHHGEEPHAALPGGSALPR